MVAQDEMERSITEGAGRPALDVHAIAALSSMQLCSALMPRRRRATVDLIETILRDRPTESNTRQLIEDLCERLLVSGLPLDRYSSSVTTLAANHDAIGRVWVRGQGAKENVYVRPADEDLDYLRSPFHEADLTQSWVELWLPETPDDRFGIVPELKSDGYVHYLCIPIQMRAHARGWVSVATKTKRGFDRQDVLALALIIPVLALIINARVSQLTLDSLLRTYVGDEPHRAILEGNVKRGQVSTIRSAILFADMRNSTGHTAEITAIEAVDLFNAFFDCLVPPIERRGGEILKYIGDGLLAIFRQDSSDWADVARRTLDAASELLANVKAFSDARVGQPPIEVGVALHYGEVAYGNVGSGLRLDFTVIGRDVGLASRIGGLNAKLSEPLLMSAAFVDRLQRPAIPLGAFQLRGIPTPVDVFRPA